MPAEVARSDPRPTPGLLAVRALNAATDDGCTAALSPLFEGAPRFLERLCANRPFDDVDRLFARAEAIALAMPEPEQIELLDAHPRLGAAPGRVSALSFREQGYDRDQVDADAALDRELERLNDEYEARFWFRYCVFVAGRDRAALLPDLRAALNADRAAELERGLRAVVAIARDRYERASG